ncbi:hypothetical protein C8R42DRAFT_647931 [Lentinula raphanica]|nr:hypothetical protein C8R42DRAFT_647931 [Lentinula raphanica]
MCLLKATVTALPGTAVQELVPHDKPQEYSTFDSRYMLSTMITRPKKYYASNSSSVTSQHPIVKFIDLGLVRFASENDGKDTLHTVQQHLPASDLDPWEYTDEVIASLAMLLSIPVETMMTWERTMIQNTPTGACRTGDFDLHVGDRFVSYKSTQCAGAVARFFRAGVQ